jgi:NADH-quinone oxidoreductase subunit E
VSEDLFQPPHLTEATDDLSAAERKELVALMRPSDAEGVPELHEVDVPAELREQIETAMSALWAVQRQYGWCTPEGIREAAAVMGVTPAYLESVASFYDLFATSPVGTHRVLVCRNISCWMRGGDDLLTAFCEAAGVDRHEAQHHGASSADGEFFVSGFECLGACDLAPMASIDQRYYGPLSGEEALAAIEAVRAGREPVPDRALAKRGAAGGPEPGPDPRLPADPVAPGGEAEEASGT